MSFIDRAVMDLISRGQIMGFIPFNDKIADITEADTNKHVVTLASLGLPTNIAVIMLGADRMSGTGNLKVYPNEGVDDIFIGFYAASEPKSLGIINERIQYALTVANDDFDVYCWGYWTRGIVVS